MSNKIIHKGILSQKMYMGTYGTILEGDDEQLIEEMGEDVIDRIDYKKYYEDVAKEIFELSKTYLKEKGILDKLGIIKMEWAGYYSPKYYNYTTDKINVDYTLKKELDEGVWMDELIDSELEKIEFDFLGDIYYDIEARIEDYFN